ncbi:MAG: molybdate ABC transporter permease subunit [Akkermansiaceae bacterium]|nr:molybdate ABC transporter permease subunit [Akkermansiaceae bacterium]
MLNAHDLTALAISVKLAAITVLLLLLIGTPLAWWLARTRCRFKFLLEAVFALPLVLPPTVLGFYLLMVLGPQGAMGKATEAIGGQPLAFTFSGLVIGSMVYSLPFVVQPLQSAFSALGSRPLEVAATLRASPIDRFLTVGVPLARSGFLTATVLGFAHTLGEFGVVLMIGGNIPGRTQVASIAIYDHVESLQYTQAHMLAGVMLLLSFLMLIVVYAANGRFNPGNL